MKNKLKGFDNYFFFTGNENCCAGKENTVIE